MNDSSFDGWNHLHWLFINANNTPRVARIDLTRFETDEILEIPNSAGGHASPFTTPDTKYLVSATRFSVPVPNTDLPAFAALDPPPAAVADWPSLEFGVCPLLLEVMLERVPPPGQRWARLDELDSLMRPGPRWLGGTVMVAPTAFANYTIARLRESQGDLAGALAAIRRREVGYFPAYLWSLPAFLRQEGRRAALAGDVPGALNAYDQYLAMRTNPAAPLRAQRDSVVSERAALQPSSSRP